MIELNDNEKKIIKALNALGGRAYTKKIAEKANISSATAGKYLPLLERKNLVESNSQQPPHIYWELIKSKDVEEVLELIA